MNRRIVICVMILGLTGLSTSQANCPNGEDYAPCKCWTGSIECNRVPLEDVRAVFRRTTAMDLDLALELTPLSTETIPADLLAGKRFSELYLICPNTDYQLVVHPDAFRSSESYTTKLTVGYCDLAPLDFSFTNGFNEISSLEIRFSFNAHLSGWNTLPSLPSLSTISIRECRGLNEWQNFPLLSNGLTEFSMYSNQQDPVRDAGMSRILSWLMNSSSRTTLKKLQIYDNALTSVPPQIGWFTQLEYLDISDQSGISVLPSGSLFFSSPVRYLYIISAYVNSIERLAFQGDFSNAKVSLAYNRLTRFPSEVFYGMLQQMEASNGSLGVNGNLFDCTTDPCHLAWLLRDNRHFLTALEGAQCFNGVPFENLDPAIFDKCP